MCRKAFRYVAIPELSVKIMGRNWPSEDGGEHEKDIFRASSLCKGKKR